MFNFFRRHKEVDSLGIAHIIIGLGNPGKEYQYSRHNIGFMAIDKIAEHLDTKTRKYQARSMTGSGVAKGKKILLAKPQTYMNNSGSAVKELVRFYKVEPERMLVIHDDVDLPLGALRLRAGGSSGGQKGMDSIIRALGTNAFPRLRIGIGRPPGRMDTAHYVLEGFLPSEHEQQEIVLEKALQAVMTFISAGIEQAMNDFNGILVE